MNFKPPLSKNPLIKKKQLRIHGILPYRPILRYLPIVEPLNYTSLSSNSQLDLICKRLLLCMNLSIHDKLHNNLYCCNCCNFAEFLNPYLDESKVAWHKTLSAQTSQQLLLCMYPSISIMTTIKCLLYALEY